MGHTTCSDPQGRLQWPAGTFHLAGLLGNCALLKSSSYRVTNMTLGWEENLDVLMIPVSSYSVIKKLCIVRVFSWAWQTTGGRSQNQRSLWCSGTTVNKHARVKLKAGAETSLSFQRHWLGKRHHLISAGSSLNKDHPECLHLNIEPEPMNQWYEKENSIRMTQIIQDYSTKPQLYILKTGNKYFDFETISIIHLACHIWLKTASYTKQLRIIH